MFTVVTLLASMAGAHATPDRGYNCASSGCHTTPATGVTSLVSTAGNMSVSPRLDGGSTSSLPFYSAKPGDTIVVNVKAVPQGTTGDKFAFAITPGSTSTSIASGVVGGVKNSASNKLTYSPTTPSGWTAGTSGAWFYQGPVAWTSGSTAKFTITVGNSTPSDVYSMTFRASGINSNTGTRYTQASEFFLVIQSSAPTASTGAASSLTTSGAVVSGTVNPNGVSTSAYFQYGTSTSYGLASGTLALGSGTTAVGITGTLSGLSAGTVYHYRAVGVSASGTAFGSDATFTTVFNPPSVSTVTASKIGPDSATLNGTVNPNGQAATAWFEYGPDTNYGSATSSQSISSGTMTIGYNSGATGLSASTTYHFRAVAASSTGTTQGADQSFTTLPPAPSVATGTASAITYQSANLNGTVNPNGVASTYYFRYGTTTAYGSTTGTQSAGSGSSPAAASASISGLAPAGTYHFQIVAVSTSGTSFGADQTFATPNGPPAVTTGSASAITPQGGTLNGAVNPGGLSTSYYFQYGLTTGYGTTTGTQSAGSGAAAQPVNAAISGLATSTAYHFQLVAVNASGTTFGADQVFTTLPPAPVVTTGTASSLSSQGATLNGALNPNGLLATAYFQYGTTTNYGNSTSHTVAGSGTSASAFAAIVSGLSASTTYHYQLVAVTASGTSFGADQTFTTLSGPPVVVTGSASAVGGQSATLNGTANPNGADTSVYFKYGTSASYGSMTSTQSAGAGSSALPFNAAISGLNPKSTYHFAIVAVSASGTSTGTDQTFTTTASSNNNLANLGVSAGSFSPAFASGQTSYSCVVANSVAKLTVTPTAADAGATIGIRINGAASFAAVVSGKPSAALALNAGSNLVEVKVTAPDGSSKTYSVTVYRVAAPVTGSASVNGIEAVLDGTVDGHGGSFAFQYGLTTAYGQSSNAQILNSGSSSVMVSATLNGLVPAATYHYRIVSTTGTLNDYGADGTFVTSRAYADPDVAAQGDLAPGISGSAKFLSFGNPAINYSSSQGPATEHWAFQALVSGSGVTKLNNSGIWLYAGNDNATLVARTGDLAPGGGVFATLRDPVLNNNDEVAFIGTVSGTGVTSKNSQGIWASTSGSLHLVARTQSTPLDGSGTIAASFQQVVLPDQNGVIFLANLVNGIGGTLASNNQGIWVENNGQLTKLIRKGDFLIGGGTISALSIFGSPLVPAVGGQTRSFDPQGNLSFKAIFTNGTQGVYVLSGGNVLTPVLATGTLQAGPFAAPTKILSLGNPILNEAGNTAFLAFISGTAKGSIVGGSILAETGSSSQLGVVALSGSLAPDVNGVTGLTGTFASLSDPVFNGKDQVAFIGKLKTGGAVTGANAQGIWTNTSGQLTLAARAGSHAPDCPAGTNFQLFTQLALPEEGGVVFVANLVGTGVKSAVNQGIWAADTAGVLHLVARKGDVLIINGTPKVVASMSIFGSTLGTAGQTRTFNRMGDLIYKVTFTDKTQALRKVVFP